MNQDPVVGLGEEGERIGDSMVHFLLVLEDLDIGGIKSFGFVEGLVKKYCNIS